MAGSTILRLIQLAVAVVIATVLLYLSVLTYIFKRICGTWKVTNYKEVPAVLRNPKFGNHQFINLKKIKLHYVEKGDRNKPLLLCIHGFPEFWYSWRHQLVEFSDNYWVVAIDMRGYGESDKPSGRSNYKMNILVDDIAQLIEGLGKKSCHFLAHDWGGLVSFTVAITRPDLVDKLIVLNTPHPGSFVDYMNKSIMQRFRSWYILFFQVPFLPELFLRLNRETLFANAFGMTSMARERITDADVDAYKYTFSRKGAWTPPIHYFRANFFKGVRNFTSKVVVPTLQIWGTKDSYLELGLTIETAHYVENLTVKLIERGSHWIQQDHPQEVNKYIREFLES